jgi:hypothetical protein
MHDQYQSGHIQASFLGFFIQSLHKRDKTPLFKLKAKYVRTDCLKRHVQALHASQVCEYFSHPSLNLQQVFTTVNNNRLTGY